MSHSTTLGLTTPSAASAPTVWTRWLSVSILLWLGLIATILVSRRLAGALHEPLSTAALATLGLATTATASAARCLHRIHTRGAPARRRDTLVLTATTAAALAIAAAVSVRGTSTAGLTLLWSILVLAEGGDWLWTLCRHRRDIRNIAPSPATSVPGILLIGPPCGTGILPVPHGQDTGLAEPFGTLAPDQAPADGVTQQFTRLHTADGKENLSGWIRVKMPAGSRTSSAHVAFCPPFARTPSVEVRQIGGPPGRVKPAQVLPYGARLELKLDHPSPESTSILLRFVATLPTT